MESNSNDELISPDNEALTPPQVPLHDSSFFGLEQRLYSSVDRFSSASVNAYNYNHPLTTIDYANPFGEIDIVYSTPPSTVSSECECDPCECEDKPEENITTECLCDPCECDVPLKDCVCDPCECDLPPDECICNPCECDASLSNKECICNPCECNLPQDECICNPCECDIPPCRCDPCECEIPIDETESESEFDLFSPRGDNGKAFFEKLQKNLIDGQKEYCNENLPKPWGVKLTEEVVFKLLIRYKSGKSSVYLPGNQIYPALLKRRIEDEDVECITHVLLQLRSVTGLNLAYNNITDVGMTYLASTIQECGNIEHVNLRNNDFTSAGIVTLTKALLYRPPLQSLKLSGVKFGIEGIDGLTCVIMAGRCPRDLDLSECDLNLEGFQTICTALHSLDHGIDYPNYLLNRPLPVDLVTLKSIKLEYNEDMAQMRLLDRTVSETDYLANARPCRKVNRRNEGKEATDAPLKANVIRDVLEDFSANALEGLLDIRLQSSEEVISVDHLQEEYDDENVGEMIAKSKTMADVNDMISQYNARKYFDGQVRHLHIVNPSLYELDNTGPVDFIDAIESSVRTDKHQTSLASRLAKGFGRLLGKTGIGSDSSSDDADMPSPDEATAEKAAREMTEFLISSASAAAGKCAVPDTTDIVQLVLMSIGDLAQMRKTREEEGGEFSNDECMRLLDGAMERVANLLSPQVPPHCDVTDSQLRKFVRAFFNSSHRTFMKLFDNPYICMALAQEGTIACRDRQRRDAEYAIRPPPSHPTTETEIRYIAMQFLDGAIKEAGRMIGSGDPFGFRVKNTRHQKKESDEFSQALKTLLTTEKIYQTEDEFEDLVQGLLEASGRMAAATKVKARKIQRADKEFKVVADVFVEDLFKQVYTTICDYRAQKTEKYFEDEVDDKLAQMQILGHYPFISRPTRLILNRPFFHHHEELMGSKLGDFIRDNTSIKALHIQKWNLGEDGMIALMNGLMLNTTLVLLDLANNELGGDGVKLLGAYLGVNKNLKHLILNHNRLKDPGLLHLVDNLAGSSILSLNIAYNNITWVGLDPLLTIITSTNIRYLYLWGNSYGVATWDLLNYLMRKHEIEECDLCLQIVDGIGCVVKNSQFRDVNYWYEVPPTVEKDCQVPPYYLDQVHDPNFLDNLDPK